MVIDIAMDTVGKVYVLAGVANIGGLLMFNRFYTHSTALAGMLLQLIYKLSYSVIANANLLFVGVYYINAAMAPSVFSTESQMLINLWGLAYIGTGWYWTDILRSMLRRNTFIL